MADATKNELNELRDDILETKISKNNVEKKLIFDGRQYSLRFPKKYVDESQIDISKDVFDIELKMPDPSTEEKPNLTATLKRK